MNGHSIFARNLHTDNMVPMNQDIATLLEAALPEGYRPNHSSLQAAEKDLKRLAAANGWTEVTDL